MSASQPHASSSRLLVDTPLSRILSMAGLTTLTPLPSLRVSSPLRRVYFQYENLEIDRAQISRPFCSNTSTFLLKYLDLLCSNISKHFSNFLLKCFKSLSNFLSSRPPPWMLQICIAWWFGTERQTRLEAPSHGTTQKVSYDADYTQWTVWPQRVISKPSG
jgi:hypothetical protein